MQKQLIIETSPQIKTSQNTAKIMWTVVIALIPAGIWGVVSFGYMSIIVLLITIAASVLTEYVLNIIFKRKTIFDGSAVLTGLLIGFNMPPAVPLFIPVVASVFAIAVVKWSFGGLGGNWMNPALAGRVFVFFSWTGGMNSWKQPSALSSMPDALSSATPLGLFKTGMLDYSGGMISTSDFLQKTGYTVSVFAENIAGFFHDSLGIVLKPLNIDLFVGNSGGCIGEVSALLLILGAALLFFKKIITWHIPVAYLGSFILFTWIFGGLSYGFGFFNGEIWFNLFSGGLILGAFFMATDMVTS
ncbi:MAG: RnfABCDGE type electron transport complex subunit D, partial [Spirochaetales bacterium]|nr:RnfABCDGE type electron transport complex subunit D [Spirochaetales bacterium]